MFQQSASSRRQSATALYVTYDGLADQLGKSQVLPYVRGLAKRGHEFRLLSFEKPGAPLAFGKLIAPGVRWFALRYHQTPTLPATAFDMAQGLGTAAAFDLWSGIRLVHVRSYVPAAMILPLIRLRRLPFLFDMRGLWPDERIEAGAWGPEAKSYRVAKRVERLLLGHASAITVLTESMRRYLREEYPARNEIKAPICVIPTCTDLDAFHPAVLPDREMGQRLGGARVLTYIGSLGRRYLPEEMARFYLAWRKHGSRSRFLVVSGESPSAIEDVLRSGGAESELVHCAADRARIPGLLRCATAGVFLYRDAKLSTRGTAPTKLGEMLACGLPVAGTGVGDVERVLQESGAGIVVRGSDAEALTVAATQLAALELNPEVHSRARALAVKWFSLERGVEAYSKIYEALLGTSDRKLEDASWP